MYILYLAPLKKNKNSLDPPREKRMNWQSIPSPLLINFEFIKITSSMDLTKFFEIFGPR